LRSRIRFGRYRGRRVPFSSFAFPDSFSTEPRSSGLIFMFCAPGLLFGRYRGRRVPFSCFAFPDSFRAVRERQVPFLSFALPDSFSTVPTVSGLVFMFCAPGLFLGGTEAVRAHFQVLHSRTLFGRYRGRRVPLSCFALPDSFRAVSRAPGPNFMFCAPGLVFDGIGDIGSRWHILLSRTRFWLYQGHRGPF
jgi:hypothetical protein